MSWRRKSPENRSARRAAIKSCWTTRAWTPSSWRCPTTGTNKLWLTPSLRAKTCAEKPLSHSAADGVAMVEAAKKSDRIVQIGSQRTSSVLCAKAKELYDSGAIGELSLVEATYGRNDPTGAWEYPPPADLSLQNVDWDTWLGSAPKKPFDPNLFARWRCW